MTTTPPLLLIISGHPCTGKTTLGRRLAADLHLPFLHKDGIKERLFDTLGTKDREWSRTLGQATYSLLFYMVEVQLTAGKSVIVESNFAPQQGTQEFRALQARHTFSTFQLQCLASGPVLLERFKCRSASNERHSGHQDHLNYDEMESRFMAGYEGSLDIDSALYTLDTTDFSTIDYPALLQAIQTFYPALHNAP